MAHDGQDLTLSGSALLPDLLSTTRAALGPADAILETRLYRLAKLEIESIRADLEEKRGQAAQLEELLDSDKKRWRLIRKELKAIKSPMATPAARALARMSASSNTPRRTTSWTRTRS